MADLKWRAAGVVVREVVMACGVLKRESFSAVGACACLLFLGCADHEAAAAQDAGRAELTSQDDAGQDAGDESSVSANGSRDASLSACMRRDGGCVIRNPLAESTSSLDLLFVVDDSSSMQEEQAALANEFPRMLRKLTTGDHDEDGEPDHMPITDLHLGVISTNLGGSDAFTCVDDGDNSRLLHSPTSAAMDAGRSCAEDYPSFLTFEEGQDADALANDFACIALLGTDGCGFEQPLEAALKAVWPSANPDMEFLGHVPGNELPQGDRSNAGFVRSGGTAPTTLGIVIVTDEDDCSAFDTTMFLSINAQPPYADSPINFVCVDYPQNLYPLERYLYGYRNLPLAAGSRVVFAAITGVPVDLVDQVPLKNVDFRDPASREAHYQGILDDPRMEVRVDTTAVDDRLVPACVSDLGRADPARRLVQVARQFGEAATVQSICGDNLSVPVDTVIRAVAEPLL